MKNHVGRKREELKVAAVKYVPTPDGQERLSHALKILLNATAMDASQSKDNPASAEKGKPPSQAATDDVLGVRQARQQ